MDFQFLKEFTTSASTFIQGYHVFWVLFAVVFIFYTSTTSVLMYHWRTYALNTKTIRRVEVLYFLVSAALIIASIVSLIIFES